MSTPKPVWQGRFEDGGDGGGGLDPDFKRFNDSLSFDHRLLPQDIAGSVAWAHALVGAGVLTQGEANLIESGLGEILSAVEADPALIRSADDEDVHSFVERELTERVGDLGKKLHTGRSRNDQVATDLRLWCAQECQMRLAELHLVRSSIVELAQRELGTFLPGHTHLQPAQPVLFSHWCMAWFEMLDRDAARFEAARAAALDACPLGCGALAGTAYPIDREALAQALGFVRPSTNSLDSVSDRDYVLDALHASVACMTHLSRLAEDLIFYSSETAGFVALPDAVTTGSSMMPQKKNPDGLELIRGKAGRVLGSYTGLAATLKALPTAYNKDLQEDKEPLFDAMQTVSMSLRVLVPMFTGLRVNRDRTEAAAVRGHTNATDLADQLVRAGVPFREAYSIVGAAVREAIKADCVLQGLEPSVLSGIDPRLTAEVVSGLDPQSVLDRRAATGGTAEVRVTEAIQAAKMKLA
ncbi:MAG: argininosuccinate lyase [Phycisphaerales bacterium]|jgi:argininosuccinate lyase